jgi:hypothetical protein
MLKKAFRRKRLCAGCMDRRRLATAQRCDTDVPKWAAGFGGKAAPCASVPTVQTSHHALNRFCVFSRGVSSRVILQFVVQRASDGTM